MDDKKVSKSGKDMKLKLKVKMKVPMGMAGKAPSVSMGKKGK